MFKNYCLVFAIGTLDMRWLSPIWLMAPFRVNITMLKFGGQKQSFLGQFCNAQNLREMDHLGAMVVVWGLRVRDALCKKYASSIDYWLVWRLLLVLAHYFHVCWLLDFGNFEKFCSLSNCIYLWFRYYGFQRCRWGLLVIFLLVYDMWPFFIRMTLYNIFYQCKLTMFWLTQLVHKSNHFYIKMKENGNQ